MRLVLALLVLLLGGCASDPEWAAAHDRYGNRYPERCAALQTAEVDSVLASAIYMTVPAEQLPFRWMASTTILSFTGQVPVKIVRVRNDLRPEDLADTRKHEACHIVMFLETGNAQWHAQSPGETR